MEKKLSRSLAEGILDDIKAQRTLVYQMEIKAREALEEIVRKDRPDLDDGDFFFYLQGWKCEKSPITLCVYTFKGMGEDECIFCGKPEERK